MAFGSRKRKIDEWEMSEIEESSNVTMHRVATELSPLKVSAAGRSLVARVNGGLNDHVTKPWEQS